MNYSCPICGTETYKSNLCNPRPLHRIRRPVEIELLDTIADKDARIAELEKERDEARRDAKSMAADANLMMHMLEHKDYPDATTIMEKYK